MKLSVGDRVRIKSREAIKVIREKEIVRVDPSINEIAGTIRTIEEVYDGDFYYVNDYHLAISIHLIDTSEIEKQIKEDIGKNYRRALEECYVTPEDAICLNGAEVMRALKQYEVPTSSIKVWDRPEGYIFKDESGNVINATKIVLEKKKKEYPKTYKECCKVLNIAVRDLVILDNMLDTTEIIYTKNLDRLLNSFRKLLICRDAYWKLYGEEMGLSKSWEPDYDSGVDKFGIVYFDNTIMRTGALHRWEKLLEFPTEEMRDAFYENFKEEIEICKELL